MAAVLVLTGVSSRADVGRLPDGLRPEGIVEDLRAFV
jgi:hypothetical protein